MSTIIKTVSYIEFESNLYPVSHWKRLREFAVGDAQDPRMFFLLRDDMWDAWRYAPRGMPSRATLYRLKFGRYKTYLMCDSLEHEIH